MRKCAKIKSHSSIEWLRRIEKSWFKLNKEENMIEELSR